MIVGVITTRDVLMHPISVVSIQGIRGFLRLLWHAMSKKQYTFTDLIEITTSTFIGRKTK